MDKYKIAVIGGGPGGYVAAIRLSDLGHSVTLIDKGKVGGTCLNCGCIPTKALLHCASIVREVQEAKKLGINAEIKDIDFSKIDRFKTRVVDKLSSGVSELLNSRKISVLNGIASFVSPTQIRVNLQDGGTTIVDADYVIIATGSVPFIPGIFDMDDIWDSTRALDFRNPPKSLTIVGGGVVGMEIASVYSQMGTNVEIIEATPRILNELDDDTVTEFLRVNRRCFRINTGCRVKEISNSEGEKSVVYTDADGNERISKSEAVLIATGRKANIEGLSLDAVGVKTNSKGYIIVDEHLRTNVENIFAIGDVNGRSLLAHAASAQGSVVARVINGEDVSVDNMIIPWCVYANPEVAGVGISERRAKEQGIPYKVGKFPFYLNGKAISMNETDGFVKIITRASDEKIIGAQIIGTHATDLIGEIIVGIDRGATADQIMSIVHPHPTLSEAVMEAMECAVNGNSVHNYS